METYVTKPLASLPREMIVAPDKSLSHRALIFSSLAQGVSKIRNLLMGEDVLRTLTILGQLGVKTSRGVQEVSIEGQGGAFTAPETVLYCGNSGTTMRLLLGVLSTQSFVSVLTGDDSLNKRPMERIFKPLRAMGACFESKQSEGERLILTNSPEVNQSPLQGIQYDSPVASAQVKTAVLLAGLFAEGSTTVKEPYVSRNHTELLLQHMGADLKVSGERVTLRPGAALKPLDITIPADISSAAFFLVAALLVPGSDVLIKAVGVNPTRSGIIDVLQRMGADLVLINERFECGEAVADLRVRSSELKNVDVCGADIPRLIDEIPILSLAACFASGTMVIRDAAELRVKESDRLAAICRELTRVGGDVQATDDGLIIHGKGSGWQPDAAAVCFDSGGDHRMAMMSAIAGLRLTGPAQINDVACVRTSFPNFFEILEGSG